MPEQLRQLLNRVSEWWNKFTAKQKTLVILTAAGVVMVIAIVPAILSRPQWVLLLNCADAREASEVTALLDGQSIKYKVSDDGLWIDIVKDKQAEANMLLGANDIQPASYTYTIDPSSDFDSDKQKRYKLYLETKLADDIITLFEAIKSARVALILPENDGTLISKDEEASAFILLELQGEFTADNAAYLAKAVSVGLGCKTPQNMVIMDTAGNMLFSGDDI